MWRYDGTKKGDAWWVNARSIHDRAKSGGLEYENVAGRKQYEAFLESQQSTSDPFPMSTAPANVDALTTPDWETLHDIYAATLEPYEFPVTESDKIDYVHNPNEGYKLHLNVPVANVREVSAYLKKENYYHKFLSGGDDPGSIFSLYIGSHKLAFQLSKKLSNDLSTYLAKPERDDEVELAPNIVGRFSTEKDLRYTKYGCGLRGMSCLREYSSSYWIKDPTELKEYLYDAFKATYASLAKDFGAYFHG